AGRPAKVRRGRLMPKGSRHSVGNLAETSTKPGAEPRSKPAGQTPNGSVSANLPPLPTDLSSLARGRRGHAARPRWPPTGATGPIHDAALRNPRRTQLVLVPRAGRQTHRRPPGRARHAHQELARLPREEHRNPPQERGRFLD